MSVAVKANGTPLVTNQPLSGEIGLVTVVVGAVPSILSTSGAAAVSALPAPSVLWNVTEWVPSPATEKGPV